METSSGLPEQVRSSMQTLFPTLNLTSVKLKAGIPWVVRFFGAIRPEMFVWRRTIYVRPERFDQTVSTILDRTTVAVLAHELVHVRQFQELGALRLAVRYLLEYWRNRMRGMTRYDAYRAISFEQEAHAVERSIAQQVNVTPVRPDDSEPSNQT